jgi:hypothetical protein
MPATGFRRLSRIRNVHEFCGLKDGETVWLKRTSGSRYLCKVYGAVYPTCLLHGKNWERVIGITAKMTGYRGRIKGCWKTISLHSDKEVPFKLCAVSFGISIASLDGEYVDRIRAYRLVKR